MSGFLHSRDQLREWVLRRLGHPLVRIELSPDQIEDAIDETLQMFYEWHLEGTQMTFRKYQITQEDINKNKIFSSLSLSNFSLTADDDGTLSAILADNQGLFTIDGKASQKIIDNLTGIEIPNEIIGINRVLKISASSVSGFFGFNYQYMMSNWDLFFGSFGSNRSFGAGPLTGYQVSRQYMADLDFALSALPPVRFSRVRNRLQLDIDWNTAFKVGDYIILECYSITDPEIHTEVWNEPFIRNMTTALATIQWGINLTKYGDVELLGGVKVNGADILSRGQADKDKLIEEMKGSFFGEGTVAMMVG